MDAGISIEEKQDLVLLYQSGELSEKEHAEVHEMLQSDEELQRFLADVEIASEIVHTGVVIPEFTEVGTAASTKEEQKETSERGWAYLLVASVAALFVLGVLIGVEPAPEVNVADASGKQEAKYSGLNRFRSPLVTRVSKVTNNEIGEKKAAAINNEASEKTAKTKRFSRKLERKILRRKSSFRPNA